jgi:tetratricopeptide (TPR) repeat protein
VAYTADVKDRWQQKFLLTAGADKSTWRAWRWRAGLEYQLLAILALRGGLNADGWSAGAGLSYAGVGVDYALDGQELGLTHRFSLTYRFGLSLAAQRAERERLRQEALDREVAARAEQQVKQVREELERQLRSNEKKYRQEKQALLAKQEKIISNAVAQERQKLADQKNQELELAYFKSLHYFNGIKAYMNKNYTEAVAEFETVAKFDPQYLELPFYLARSRQLAGGKFMVMKPESLALYYRGIDLYVDNQFAEAVAVWKQILAAEPNNMMVLRNIEEAEGRQAMLKKAGGEVPAAAGNTEPAGQAK